MEIIILLDLPPLAKARKNKGLSIADITRLTGLSYDNYIKHEKEEVKAKYMSLDTLQKLSKLLEIDLITDYHRFKMYASQCVIDYMTDNNLSISRFAERCGVSTTTVKNWRRGVCSPSYELWEKIFR